MKLSKTAAHAALALMVLAEHDRESFLQAREIARRIGIPTVSALKILQTLARQELIVSQLGRAGGYTLGSAADAITMLDVVEAIDGPISGQIRVSSTPAPFEGGCEAMQRVCDRAAVRMREELASLTVHAMSQASATAGAASGSAAVRPGADQADADSAAAADDGGDRPATPARARAIKARTADVSGDDAPADRSSGRVDPADSVAIVG